MKFNRLAIAVALSVTALSATAAKYRVEPLGFVEKAENNFVATINEQGDVVSVLQEPYEPPIDRTLIDFDSDFMQENLTDVESAREGNFNTADYEFLAAFVKSGRGSLFSQQLAEFQSYITEGEGIRLITAFDVINPDLEDYTQSSDTIVRKIKHGYAVGTSAAPFYNIPYVNEEDLELTYVVNDFAERGFIQNDNIVVGMPAVDQTLGGKSEAFDINVNLQVAGYSTTEATDSLVEAVELCNDDEERGDRPLEACLRSLMNSGALDSNMQRRATIWDLRQRRQCCFYTHLRFVIRTRSRR